MSMTRNLAVLARGPPTATPPLLLTTLLEAMATTSMVPATPTLTGAPRVFTRGRLSPASTATPMVSMPMMATSMWRGTRMTVTVMATTRGRQSPATPLLSLTTPLVATATTSTALATPTPIGLPRVFKRGRPLALATSRYTVAIATATTVRTPNMAVRSMVTTPRSTRLVMDTTSLTTTDSTSKAL